MLKMLNVGYGFVMKNHTGNRAMAFLFAMTDTESGHTYTALRDLLNDEYMIVHYELVRKWANNGTECSTKNH